MNPTYFRVWWGFGRMMDWLEANAEREQFHLRVVSSVMILVIFDDNLAVQLKLSCEDESFDMIDLETARNILNSSR